MLRKIPGSVICLILGACLFCASTCAIANPGEKNHESAQTEYQGRLSFEPARPRSAETIEVVYKPKPALSGAAAVVLRARFRAPNDIFRTDWVQTVSVTDLTPDGQGKYVGSFSLPADVLYAVFSIEDANGAAIDYRETKPWSLMVHGEDGRPLFNALHLRFSDWMHRDVREVRAAAEEMAEYYPNQVVAWYLLAFAETLALGREGAASHLPQHRERLSQFETRFGDGLTVNAEQAYGMSWYAAQLGKRELSRLWMNRLQAIEPGHFSAVNNSVNSIFEDKSLSDEQRLLAIEALWGLVEGSKSKRDIANGGFMLARRIGE